MRLWHKKLVAVLPRQQLLSQWRECCAIARNIDVTGTPNHLLVNKILLYPIAHFMTYTALVIDEFKKRGYRIMDSSFASFMTHIESYAKGETCNTVSFKELFVRWHNQRYFVQCIFNLQEKYDCQGISYLDWQRIESIMYAEQICGL